MNVSFLVFLHNPSNMDALHSEFIWKLSFLRISSVFWASFLAWTSAPPSWSWLANKAGRARSFNPLDEHVRRRFELVSVIAFVELLFMLEGFVDFNANILVDFGHELLLLPSLLDSLFHKPKSLRYDFPIEFQLDLFSFDSVIDFRNFDRKQVHHVVVPHNLLVLLSQFVIQISNLVQLII